MRDLLLYSNSNNIKFIDIKKDDLAEGDSVDIDVTQQPSAVLTYKIGDQCKLHAFYSNAACSVIPADKSEKGFYIICMVETEDNQIDFTRLYFWNRNFAANNIQFYQYTTVTYRDVKLDPIKKFDFFYTGSTFLFGLSLRQSGKVDIYWNHKRVSTSEDSKNS